MAERWFPVRNRTPEPELKPPEGGGSSDAGCLASILLALVVWALVFGVTVDGKHWTISCSGSKGVEFKASEGENDG